MNRVAVQEVYHRDIKPANVMYDAPSKTYKICDYGLVKIVGENKENADLVVSPYPSDHRAVMATFMLPTQAKTNPTADQAAFEKAEGDTASAEVFSDSGTTDWQEQWFLDGEVGTVTNSPEGMTLTAGPEFKNDAHHMVLWTEDSFSGDLKIEYDYTRLDEAPNCVTILYLQAAGSGKGPYAKDITKWSASCSRRRWSV